MNTGKPQLNKLASAPIIKNEAASPCHLKRIPLSLVLLDNVPTLLLFILGFLIIRTVSVAGAVAYGIYTLFSIVWFWGKICPYCHHYDTHACPCGYGAISPKLFKKKDTRSFRKVFRRNILIQFPNWFVPFGIAVYLLLTQYTTGVMILTILFSVIGFIIIPLISKLVGCRNCQIRDDCPWMTSAKKDKQ